MNVIFILRSVMIQFCFNLLLFIRHEKYVQLYTPLPCGYYGDSLKPCTCAPAMVTKHQKRISGPLLDRIDIHIEAPRVGYEKLSGNKISESSESIRKRVQAARDIQNKRFANEKTMDIVCNADMRIGEIRQFCQLQDEGGVLSLSKAPEFDAGGDDATQFIGARLSPHPEIITYHCRLGRD